MCNDKKLVGNKVYLWITGVAVLLLLLVAACNGGDGEDRPGIQVIESETGSVSVSVSATGTGSVSGTGVVSVSGATGVATVTGVAEAGVVQPRPSAARQVAVTLKEWAILPEQAQVEAGPVYFLVNNAGPDDPHELVIIKTDTAPGELPVVEGMVPEDQVNMIGEIEPFLPGTEASGVFNLQPGDYLLICNIAEIEEGELESHYELGMRVSFTVTGASSQGDGGSVAAGGLFIPAGLTAETSGPTKSDGIYTPTTNREIYQKISTDYQEIVALTNVVKQGQPLPAPEIMLLYEAGMHTRIDATSRTLRGFARDPGRSVEFPDSAAYYDSDTFLDTPVSNAIRKRGSAEEYTPAQQRQAILKGIQRIIYHWAKRYMILGGDRLSSRLVDEAWAVYVGEEVNGEYPNSLAATARSREANFGREGTIDIPLREAMVRAQQAADDQDQAAYDAAARDVYSRFNTIFYLASVRYMGQALQRAEAGNYDDAGVALVEGLSFYMSIQPDVAKANATADEAIVAYFESPPAELTAAQRDSALDALNGTASALFLTQDDLVTSFE